MLKYLFFLESNKPLERRKHQKYYSISSKTVWVNNELIVGTSALFLTLTQEKINKSLTYI